MKAIPAIVIGFAILLAGCSYKTKWRDVTGKERGEAEAKADLDYCDQVAQYPTKNPSDISNDAIQAAFSRLKACMTAKGWELVRDNQPSG